MDIKKFEGIKKLFSDIQEVNRLISIIEKCEIKPVEIRFYDKEVADGTVYTDIIELSKLIKIEIFTGLLLRTVLRELTLTKKELEKKFKEI